MRTSFSNPNIDWNNHSFSFVVTTLYLYTESKWMRIKSKECDSPWNPIFPLQSSPFYSFLLSSTWSNSLVLGQAILRSKNMKRKRKNKKEYNEGQHLATSKHDFHMLLMPGRVYISITRIYIGGNLQVFHGFEIRSPKYILLFVKGLSTI